MKQLVSVICGCMFFIASFGQPRSNPQVVVVTTDKTTSLIFPFPIRHVDRGSQDISVQQVGEADNLLMVKAAAPDFKPTNLSVLTSDGEVYSFEVRYQSNLSWTVFHVRQAATEDSTGGVNFYGQIMNARDMENYSKGILDNSKFLRGVVDRQWDITAEVSGVYIKDNVIFYQISIDNQSPINYDVDYVRFYIKDKRKSKRTASQEIDLVPLYQTGNTTSIKSYSQVVAAFALEKITIPDAKNFFVEIGEKNGGRHLRLKITNRKLLKAKILPSY